MHRNIKILLLGSIFLTSGINLFAPLYAVFIKNIGGSLFAAGATAGFYLVLQGILYLVFGRLQKLHLKKKKTMVIIGYFAYAIGYFLYLFVSNPIQVLGIQAILAIGEVITTPAWSAIIATSLHKGKETTIYSNFFGIRSIFQGLAALAGGYFALKLGFNAVFTIMIIFALSAGFICFSLKESEMESEKKESEISKT